LTASCVAHVLLLLLPTHHPPPPHSHQQHIRPTPTAINECVTLSSAFVDTQRSPLATISPRSTTRHNQPTCTSTTTSTLATALNAQPCNSIHEQNYRHDSAHLPFCRLRRHLQPQQYRIFVTLRSLPSSPQSLGPHPPVPACIPVKVCAAATERMRRHPPDPTLHIYDR
jgi:hypothetical protein